MASKFGRVVSYLEVLLPEKLHDLFTKYSSEFKWQAKTIISPQPQCLWPPKCSTMVTYLEGLLALKPHGPLITWYCKITWQTKTIMFSTTAVPMVTKLCRMVTLFQALQSKKPDYSCVTWSCEIMWQIETIIPPLPQYRVAPDLTGWWITLNYQGCSYLKSHITLETCCLVR